MATPMTANGDGSDEIQRGILAAREALTDSMIERLATTAGVALEVVDRLNEEETRAAVHAVVDRITELHKLGALDTLCETVLLIHAMRSAMTDDIIERLFSFVEQATNTFASEDMIKIADDVLLSLEGAAKETAEVPATSGIFGMLALLSKPEAQKTLQFLLKFGEGLHRAQVDLPEKR